jgi:hypothetical protein
MRRSAVALAILFLPSLASGPARAQGPRRALLLGSSSVSGAVGRTLDTELETVGVDLTRMPRGSSGFARPDFFDWQAEIDAIDDVTRYAAILVYTGGNDGQALRLRPEEREAGEERRDWIDWREEARWRALYAARVSTFVDQLCDRGAPRVVILLPVDGGRPGWSRRIVRVREALAAGAQASRCGVSIDAGPETFESQDGVHLTWRGASRFWAAVSERLLPLLAGG